MLTFEQYFIREQITTTQETASGCCELIEHLPQHISGHLQRCASVGTDDTDDDEEDDDSDDDIEATSQHYCL